MKIPKRKPEPPIIYADRLAKLSPEDRAKLRDLISSPLYVKLLRMVAVFKPSTNCTNAGSHTRDAYSDARANARLGEMRGWEMYETAIFLALNEPPEIKATTQETFPDEGRIDADWGRTPASTVKT